jgi:hypothetical protein
MIMAIVIIMVIILNERSFIYPFNRIIKDLSGLASITLVLNILSRLKKIEKIGFIKLLSKYSYELYLTNYLFLVGPLSLAFLTGIIFVDISLSTIVFTLFAYVISFVAKLVNNKLIKYSCKNA